MACIFDETEAALITIQYVNRSVHSATLRVVFTFLSFIFDGVLYSINLP